MNWKTEPHTSCPVLISLRYVEDRSIDSDVLVTVFEGV